MHFTKDLQRHAVPVALPSAFAGMDLGFASPAQSEPTSAYRAGFKRVFDVCAILAAAPIVIPVMAILALIVALGGGNPFYTQSRVGLNGRAYTMWKLRTMVTDADAALAKHLQSNPAARAEWDRTQKLKNDPRITRAGRLLRKTSLDELPQLLNVLKGEMSLVGPRPMLPEQQGMYPGTAYYKLLPGITGPWQVSARNETAFAERAAFDTGYHNTLSFMGDLKMLFATVAVVTRATGH
jgi:lipopolysaccharide/colanic/teichoic acid biosynthesis glycosyltransferase